MTILTLKRLDTTGRTATDDAIRVVLLGLHPIIITFGVEAAQFPTRSEKAKHLLDKINFQLIYCLCLFSRLFQLLSIPAKMSRGHNMDIIAALQLIKGFFDGIFFSALSKQFSF